LVLLSLLACSDEPSASEARADQIRAAAEEAGLDDEVADVLVLAARGVDGTFQVTYPGKEGASVVVSQDPPDRRVDVVVGGQVVESRVVRAGVGYRCAPPADDPDGSLECTRTESALEAPGAFTDDALQTFTDDLIASRDEIDLAVESRTIAEVDATCLVAVPEPGPTDANGPDVETICLSDAGAQLLVDAAGERVVAETYTTDVPDGTFDT
jgi:hypothetical protein